MRAQVKDLPDDLAAIQKPTTCIKEIIDQPHVLTGDVDGLAEGLGWISIFKMLLEIRCVSSGILDRAKPASLLKVGHELKEELGEARARISPLDCKEAKQISGPHNRSGVPQAPTGFTATPFIVGRADNECDQDRQRTSVGQS